MRAYRKQISDDPTNTAFYLECLQDIGFSTNSRTLQVYAEKEIVNGIYTRFELERAYKTLEIDHPDGIDDEGVLAVFQSRCIDVPNREKDFLHALDVIQHFRKSAVLGKTTARQSVNPQEMDTAQAYKTLRINDPQISDDGIIVSFVSCVSPIPQSNPECRLSS